MAKKANGKSAMPKAEVDNGPSSEEASQKLRVAVTGGLSNLVRQTKTRIAIARETGRYEMLNWGTKAIDGSWPSVFDLEQPLRGQIINAITMAHEAIKHLSLYWEAYFNESIRKYMIGKTEDYETKKTVAGQIGDFLRLGAPRPKGIDVISPLLPMELSIVNPKTLKLSTLVAVGSEDGQGRYLLQDRSTKKRSDASKSIFDLMPFILGFSPVVGYFPKSDSDKVSDFPWGNEVYLPFDFDRNYDD